MTTGPKLRLGKTMVPGVLAVILFGIMAAIVVQTPFESMPSQPFDGLSVTSEIGYAMFDMGVMQDEAVADTEPFLISFLLIAIVLDAALDASLVLAKREEHGEPVAALSSVPTDSGAGAGSDSDLAGGQPAATDGGHETDGSNGDTGTGGDRA